MLTVQLAALTGKRGNVASLLPLTEPARPTHCRQRTHARTHRTGALTASVRISTTQISCYSIDGLCSALRLVSAAVPLESIVGIAPHRTASLWVPSSAELAELS